MLILKITLKLPQKEKTKILFNASKKVLLRVLNKNLHRKMILFHRKKIKESKVYKVR